MFGSYLKNKVLQKKNPNRYFSSFRRQSNLATPYNLYISLNCNLQPLQIRLFWQKDKEIAKIANIFDVSINTNYYTNLNISPSVISTLHPTVILFKNGELANTILMTVSLISQYKN